MTSVAVVESLVGRRPIFDRDLDVVAYELLFRPYAEPDVDPSVGDGQFTPDGLLGAGADGIGAFVGTKRALCVAGPGVMSGAVPVMVPPDRVVLQVRLEPGADESTHGACRSLAAQGHALAIEPLGPLHDAEPLLDVASSLVMDPASFTPDEVAAFVRRCHDNGVDVIARGVDTAEALEHNVSLGFDLFEGHALLRPSGRSGRTLTPGRSAALRMSSRLFDAECPVGDLEQIVRGDPAMAHQLLQLAGIGRSGEMRRTVRSVREALVLVGWRRLQSWVALLLLTNDGATSEEDIATVLVRARLCELLAPRAGCTADAGYTAGMLSALELVLGVPTDTILDTIPVDAEIRDAVLDGQGALGDLVADVAELQLGGLDLPPRTAIPEPDMRAATLDALTWAVTMTSALEATQGN